MISCLVDYIGLKTVKDNPPSGQFVNDLHGITTDRLEISREIDENDGIDESWATIESRAINSFERDIITNLKKYYKNHQIIDTGLTGFVDSNDLADHTSGLYVGYLFDTGNYSDNLKIEFNDVRLTLASAENFNIKIFDANTGKELYTKAVTGVEGLNVVKVLQSYAVSNYNKLFICYDSVIPVKVDDDATAAADPVAASTSSQIIADNLGASETGIAIGYNVKCSVEEFVCSRLELFTEPYLYKLGIEFLKETKYSTNWNRFTLLDNAQADEIIAEYMANYQDLMDSTFHDLKVPDDGICFICSKMISKRDLIP